MMQLDLLPLTPVDEMTVDELRVKISEGLRFGDIPYDGWIGGFLKMCKTSKGPSDRQISTARNLIKEGRRHDVGAVLIDWKETQEMWDAATKNPATRESGSGVSVDRSI
jgi:hypothetical protein